MAEVPYDDIFLNITSKLDTRGLNSAVNALKGLQSITGFSGLKQAGEDLKGFIDTLNGLSARRMKTLTDFANSIKGVGGIGKAMKAVAKTAESGNPLNDTSMGEASVPQLSAGMKQVAESAKKAKEATKEVGDEAKKALTPMEKLANRFKSFLQYRAMRAVWSAITKGIKEGFSNLEAWDRRMGHTGFAESMDRARESLLVLKNSLAVVGAPFLEGLISVLQQVAQWAMVSANAISRLFAILGGKSSYRAVKWADYTANAVKGTTGAVKDAGKEFKKQLMAFDEINNITEQKGSSGGGGYGNSGYFNYDDMFEEREVGEMSEVEKKLKQAWEWIKKIGESLKPVLEVLKGIVAPLKSIWESTKSIVSIFGGWIKQIIAPAWGSFVQVLASIANLLVAVTDAIAKVFDSLVKLLVPIDNATQKLNVWQGASLILQGTLLSLKAVIDIVSGVISTIAYVVQVFTARTVYLGDIIGNLYNLLSGKSSWEEFKKSMADAETKMNNTVTKATNDLYNALDRTFNRKWYVKTVWDEIINRTIHVNEIYTAIGSKGMRTVEKYAEGGIVPQGQLFIAREAGAELVGNVGGHTAVMNNQDIVGAVSAGVAQAVASVMGGGSNVTVTLEGDAKGIFKVVQKEGRAYSARTGQPALA